MSEVNKWLTCRPLLWRGHSPVVGKQDSHFVERGYRDTHRLRVFESFWKRYSYGLNVHFPTKVICWHPDRPLPHALCSCTWIRGFQGSNEDHNGEALIQSHHFKKWHQSAPSCFFVCTKKRSCENTARWWPSASQEERPRGLTRKWFCWHFYLGFLTWENKFGLFKPPSLWYFVKAAWADQGKRGVNLDQPSSLDSELIIRTSLST